MSIRDWSSDGCSSDLFRAGGGWRQQRRGERRRRGGGGQTFPGRSHTLSPPRPNARRIAESGEGSLTLRPYLLPLRPESRTRGAGSDALEGGTAKDLRMAGGTGGRRKGGCTGRASWRETGGRTG